MNAKWEAFRKAAVLGGLVLLGGVLVAGAAQAAHYSLHDEPYKISYKDASGATQYEVRRGFRPRHDLTDPKVLCGVEGGSCPETTKIRFNVNSPSNTPSASDYIGEFKVYVPAGSTYAYLRLEVPNLARLAAKARLHAPPSAIATSEYSSLISTAIGPPSWSLFQSGEVVAKNAEGFIEILRQYFSKPLAEGAWLYVTLKSFDGSAPTLYGYAMEVSVSEYLTWYRGMTEAGWAEFGTSSVAPGGGTPTPTPGGGTPTPTPSGGTPTPTPGGDSTSFGGDVGPGAGGMGDTSSVDWLSALFGGGSTPAPTPTPSATPTPTPTPVPTPAAQTVTVPKGGVGMATFSAGGGVSVNLDPVVVVEDPPDGPVAFYAAYLKDGSLYVATKDITGKIAFEKFREGDALLPYARGNLAGGSAWEWACDAFGDLPPLATDVLKTSDVLFVVLVVSDKDPAKSAAAVFNFN